MTGDFTQEGDEFGFLPESTDETSGANARGARPVIARILWPALGFPAVIAPRPGASRNPADGDATRAICVLVLSNQPALTSQDAARYLRLTPWNERQRRTIRAGGPGSFSPAELTVRNGLVETRPEDKHGRALTFGGNREGRNGITVSLSKYVRSFYGDAKIGLRYLHEVRVSEEASGRLTGEQYHLFWNKEAQDPTGASNEMRLLLGHFAPRRLDGAPGSQERSFLMDGYKFEYGTLQAPRSETRNGGELTEVLHPLFVRRSLGSTVRIGHVTDTHVDVRNDVYERNLEREAAAVRKVTKGRPVEFNNWNRSFQDVYADSKASSDVILLTGDLIDYGRGHIGDEGAVERLGRNDQYHLDRNWFLFYSLLGGADRYTTPVYTILGNHDWRLNPYPPFAPGAPEPEELIHNNPTFTRPQFTPEERKTTLEAVLKLAHGPGHGTHHTVSYADLSEDVVEIVKTAYKAGHLVPSILFGTRANLDFKKLPTHTTIDSVAWYLLLINPFLDYRFAFPTGHEFLLLDFAEDEELNNSEGGKGQGPRSLRCLTPLQRWHVERFTKSPGRAKTIGLHVPPIGPRPDWSVNDLLSGVKTYAFPDTPRYKNARGEWREARNQPIPLMAVAPEGWSPWLAATYGTFVNGDTRRWFIETLIRSQTVRLVFSGHTHRQGLHTTGRRIISIPGEGRGEPATTVRVIDVRSVPAQLVAGAKAPLATRGSFERGGPLYVNTTSAGPRGYQYFDNGVYRSEPPGFSVVHLSSDGTISRVWQGAARPGGAVAVRARAR